MKQKKYTSKAKTRTRPTCSLCGKKINYGDSMHFINKNPYEIWKVKNICCECYRKVQQRNDNNE